MTKNNLSNCLSWLLQHPHSFGSLEHISVIADTAFGYDEAVGADTEDDMARLQLAPQIPPRSRLHTQLNNEPNPLPTPAPSRASEEPKPPSTRPKQKLATPSTSRQAPKSRTPVTSFDDIKFDDDVLDIDEIDLTGNITTSSFGAFGSPTTVWREDAASRVEPLPKKKGKKRKSDEYESDLLSPQSSRKTTKVVQQQQRTTSTFSPLRGSQTNATEKDLQEEISLTLTRLRPKTTVSKPQDDFPDFAVEETEELQGQHEIKPDDARHRPTHSNSQRSRTRRQSNVVFDSDDDEEEAFPTSKLESEPLSPTISIHGLEQGLSNTVGTPGRVQSILRSPVRSQPFKISQSPRKPIPPQISTAMTPQTTSTQEPMFKSSAASTNSGETLAMGQKKLVESFATNGQEQLQSLLQRLERSKKAVDDKIMDELCECGAASTESKERLKAIGNKITSATRLREEFVALSKLRKQREQMVTQRNELRNSGHSVDPDDPEDVLMLLCSKIFQAKGEIDARENAVFALLGQVGVSTPSSMTEQSNIGREQVLSPRPKMLDQKVLVASTQKDPQTMLKRVKDADPQSLSYLSTQSIRQTPSQTRYDVTEVSIKSSNRNPSPQQYASRRPEFSERRRDPQFASEAIDFPIAARGSMHNDRESSSRGFSRTMASPTREYSFDEDDFEDDLDDEEMYKAAEEFDQNLSSRTTDPLEMPGRTALTEVSNNIRGTSPNKKPSSQVSSSHAVLMQHPWSKDVASSLKKRFHLHGFRQNQLEAINATLSGKDAFVLMPTGGGKSLCYQLPSVIKTGRTRGVTIVVSPLLSLMQDQVDHLQKLGIQAYLVNGNSSKEARNWILKALQGPRPEEVLQLLYVTPEMLGKSQAMVAAFEDLCGRKRLARIVIDEAHCVSQWGHDFRPDYKALGEVRKLFKDVPVMALTATATENVKFDVMQNLGMKDAEVFSQSFNRPNLTYEVRPKGKNPEVLESIARTIETSYREQAGIIYCLSRKNCEKVAEQLGEKHHIKAQHYHAGMSSDERIDIQKRWQVGEFKVIVATIAFGMGIDKPDVRFVIHHTVPKSLEGYYQETGRAGRDGKRSGCYLYYGYGDTISIKEMIKKGDSSDEQKERQYQLLRNVVQFCENRSDCRRVQVLGYFNEHFDRADCKNGCDNCNSSSTFETQDFSEHARNAIRLVRQIYRSKVTVLHCVDVYRGGRNKKINEHGHNALHEYGKGADLIRGDVERLFYRLISENALTQYNKVNKAGFATQYIKPGPGARDFEAGRRSLKIQVLASPHEKVRTSAPLAKSRMKPQGTGVKASTDDYPASTNVSSPLQPRGNRRLLRRVRDDEESEDEDFIVHTSEMEADECEDNAFDDGIAQEPPGAQKASRLGPPITSDTSAALNPTHQHVLDDFVEKARVQIERISIAKSLRQRPITDRVLREIGIHFPQNETELQRISGVNDEIFKMFGPVLLRLIKAAYNDYEAIMRAQEDRPDDPNHKTVIEIVDDTNDEGEPESDIDMDQTESSLYFSVRGDVSQSNEKMAQASTSENKSLKMSGKKGSSRSRSGSWNRRGSRGSQRGGGSSRGRTSGMKGKRGTGGVAKKTKNNSSTRSSTSNAGLGEYVYKNNKGASSSRSVGGGGKISMMPT